MVIVFEELTTKGFWDWVETVSTILGNAGIFLITAYGFWLTYFSKNIKITSTKGYSSIHFGDSKNCTIYNKTLSPLIIEKITAVYDNKYEINIKDFGDTPLIVDSFKIGNIIGDRYTALSEDIDTLFFKDVYYKVKTPEKELIVKSRGKINKKACPKIVGCLVQRFDNVVLSKHVKYVLVYWLKNSDKINKIYINDNGFMSETIRDFNAIPTDILNDHNKMLKLFKDTFNNKDLNIQLYEIEQNFR